MEKATTLQFMSISTNRFIILYLILMFRLGMT